MNVAAGIHSVDSGTGTDDTAAANRLLGCLAPADRARLLAAGEFTRFGADSLIARRGDSISQIQFPVSGYAALMIRGADAATVHVAWVGCEGMIGWESLLGRSGYLLDVLVPETLSVLRIDISGFQAGFAAASHCRKLQFENLSELFTVVARSALCARFHILEARLARCLLEVHDRHPEVPIRLTQTRLAGLLGVRRSGVTTAATHLQMLGLIQYRRGEIKVLDRQRLQAAACDCYRFDGRSVGRIPVR